MVLVQTFRDMFFAFPPLFWYLSRRRAMVQVQGGHPARTYCTNASRFICLRVARGCCEP